MRKEFWCSSRKWIAQQIGHSCLIVYINQIMADYQFKGDVIQISLHYSSLSSSTPGQNRSSITSEQQPKRNGTGNKTKYQRKKKITFSYQKKNLCFTKRPRRPIRVMKKASNDNFLIINGVMALFVIFW